MYWALNLSSCTEACKGIVGTVPQCRWQCGIDFPTVHQPLSDMFFPHIQANACSKFDMVSFKRFSTGVPSLRPVQRVTAVYFGANSSCFFYCASLPGGLIMDGAGTLSFIRAPNIGRRNANASTQLSERVAEHRVLWVGVFCFEASVRVQLPSAAYMCI